MEINHKPVEKAKKGDSVAIKIEIEQGEQQKVFGRHFEATDELVSKVKYTCIFQYFNYDILDFSSIN